MNTGLIASRYANALLLLTKESGRGEQVCEQIRGILASPDDMPAEFEPDLEKLIALLKKNGRLEYLKFVLRSFVSLYFSSEGICLATLTTAIPAPGLGKKLCNLVTGLTGYRIVLDSRVDPSIIGGFVLDVDDNLFDASVRTQIETIRREFIEKNTRIV